MNKEDCIRLQHCWRLVFAIEESLAILKQELCELDRVHIDSVFKSSEVSDEA